jgi:hypothetical protein
MTMEEKPHMERIIEQRVGKNTMRKTYIEYLVKWKDHSVEDSSWVIEPDILKHGKIVQELMDRSPRIFYPEDYDAGASPSCWHVYRKSVLVIDGKNSSEPNLKRAEDEKDPKR